MNFGAYQPEPRPIRALQVGSIRSAPPQAKVAAARWEQTKKREKWRASRRGNRASRLAISSDLT